MLLVSQAAAMVLELLAGHETNEQPGVPHAALPAPVASAYGADVSAVATAAGEPDTAAVDTVASLFAADIEHSGDAAGASQLFAATLQCGLAAPVLAELTLPQHCPLVCQGALWHTFEGENLYPQRAHQKQFLLLDKLKLRRPAQCFVLLPEAEVAEARHCSTSDQHKKFQQKHANSEGNYDSLHFVSAHPKSKGWSKMSSNHPAYLRIAHQPVEQELELSQKLGKVGHDRLYPADLPQGPLA